MQNSRKPAEVSSPEIQIENHGSIFLFHPLSSLAEMGIEKNASHEGFHPDWPTLVVKHRYAADIAEAMKQAGLTLQ